MKTSFLQKIMILLLSFSTILSLQAQEPPEVGASSGGGGGDKVVLGTVDLNQEFVETPVKRPMVSATRIQRTDQTGKAAYNPNEMIQIPDGGKLIPASVYYAEIEKLEAQFNAKGYSPESDPAENIVGRVKVDPSALTNQRTSQAAGGVFMSPQEFDQNLIRTKTINNRVLSSPDRMTDADFNGMKASNIQLSSRPTTEGSVFEELPMVGAGGVGAVGANKPAGTLLKQFNLPTSKEWAYGSRSSFQARITGGAVISGKIFQPAGNLSQLNLSQTKDALGQTNSEVNFSASGRVDGSIFNRDFNVLNVTASARVPANNSQKATIGLGVTVVGVNVFNMNESFPQSFDSKLKRIEKYKEISQSYSTVIVVVPITGSVGIKGKVGVDYRIYGDKQSLRGSVSPYAELTGFADAAINLLVVKAGVRGTITFIRGRVNLEGDLILTVQNGLVLSEVLYAGYDINFLSGKVELYAKIWKLWKGWKTYSHTIWDYPGFNVRGSFYNHRQATAFAW
jgi:hypothetical protein